MSGTKLTGGKVFVTFEDETHTALTIAGSTSCSLELSGSQIDATTKDDDDSWEAQLNASKSWSLSWDGLVVEDGNDSTATVIMDALIANKLVSCVYRIGKAQYKGSGYITSTSVSGAVKDLAKANFSISGYGKLTRGQNVVESSGTSGTSGN